MLLRLPRSLINLQMRNLTLSSQLHNKYVPKILSLISKPNVSVLYLNGIIRANQSGYSSRMLNLSNIETQIDKAFAVKKLKCVCLVVNSPGGSPAQSELIADKIIQKSKKAGVEVISFVEDTAASGGYWLACAGGKIYVCNNSFVGSIGVISGTFGLDEFIKRYDITRRIYTAGKSKAFLDVFQPEKEEDITKLNTLLKHTHNNFITYVKERRNGRLNGTDEKLFNGEVWVGQQAVDMGLADGVKNLTAYIEDTYGVVGKDVNVVKFNQRQRGFQSLFSSQIPDLQDLILGQKYRLM